MQRRRDLTTTGEQENTHKSKQKGPHRHRPLYRARHRVCVCVPIRTTHGVIAGVARHEHGHTMDEQQHLFPDPKGLTTAEWTKSTPRKRFLTRAQRSAAATASLSQTLAPRRRAKRCGNDVLRGALRNGNAGEEARRCPRLTAKPRRPGARRRPRPQVSLGSLSSAVRWKRAARASPPPTAIRGMLCT